MQTHRNRISYRRMALGPLATCLYLIVVVQQIQPYLCFHDPRNYHKRLLHANVDELSLNQVSADSLPVDKRTIIAGTGIGGSASQPEEIFSASDQLESNYDEYPMVVPKRAALLLDRLMVALHHALEKEHSGSSRLTDFYNKNSNSKNPAINGKGKMDSSSDAGDPLEKDPSYLTMYSDDDPSVMMDYDFKDLNSINRATGETLMGQSFQRRANLGLDLGGDIGKNGGVSSLLSTSTSPHVIGGGGGGGGSLIGGVNSGDMGGGGGRTNFGPNGGRMYWRCYFNAVSCF